MRRHGMVGSMSRVGDCWDNAVVESFFATVKTDWCTERSGRRGPPRAVAWRRTSTVGTTISAATPR